MALTQTDLAALDKAIAGAELTVNVDGASVTYRSVQELRDARKHVASVLATQTGTRRGVFHFTPVGRRD